MQSRVNIHESPLNNSIYFGNCMYLFVKYKVKLGMSKFKNYNDAATVAELKLVFTVYACKTVRDVLYCNRNYVRLNKCIIDI